MHELGLIGSDRAKYERLLSLLTDYGSVLVAYSGGVDSALLAAAAQRALGAKAIAVTARSESMPVRALEEAARIARLIGIEHRIVETGELAREEYARNAPDRCYHCKSELFGVLGSLAAREGWRTIAYGAIVDDLADYRPGAQAAREFKIAAPLVEAGLSKAEIRETAKELGLPVWDKPASPCLSSRIPHGERVTGEKLSMIEQAEELLHSLGFRECRVRHHGEIARIEVPPGDISRLSAREVNEPVVARLKALGFRHVALDLAGFKSGGLNPDVNPAVRQLPSV